MAATPEEEKWIRGRWRAVSNRVGGILGVGLAIAWIAASLWTPHLAAWARVLFALAAIVPAAEAWWLLVWASRMGALPTPEGLVISGAFSVWRIPWDLIEGFSVGFVFFPGIAKVVTVRLKDGGISRIRGITVPILFPGNRWTVARIDALEQELARHRPT